MREVYDEIGRTYSEHRRTDPRLAALVHAAIGDTTTVLNVGAGTGSYEPTRAGVIALEPSATMVAQRAPRGAPVVRGLAERLPFRDRSFDVVLAILTIHHWNDWRAGLAECARVARDRIVIWTWDPESAVFWLVRDYFPEMSTIDLPRFPSMDELRALLGPIDVAVMPIPCDCVDGFLGAYWRRPEAYLDASVRGGISSFSRIPHVEQRMEQLRADLESGEWARRNGDLLGKTRLDLGYRLVVATLVRD